MKKFLKSFLAIVICVCACLTFTACGDTVKSKTSNDTSKVMSNGGIVLYNDGWVYFVNGSIKNTEDNIESINTQATIYRAKANARGEIEYTTKDDGEGNLVKDKMVKVEKIVTSLVGFENGSIYVFGDYIYYATPHTGKNSSGKMLNGKTEFRRFDLVNKYDQLIYTTKKSDDTISYEYYKQGEGLYLVVYEETSKTLTSLKVDSKITKSFERKDVTSAVFSEDNAQTETSSIIGSDSFVYYTMSYDKDSVIRTGNRVFSIKPNGAKEEKLSEGITISLLSVHEGFLVYADEEYIYAEKITDDTEELNVNNSNIVCYSTYKDKEVIFIADSGKLAVLTCDNKNLRKIKWVNNELSYENIEKLDDDVTFIGIEGDYVIYMSEGLIYKVKFQNITGENLNIQLSKTVFNEIGDDDDQTLIIPEIMNGYVYALSTEKASSTTYLYRVLIDMAEDAELENAELIGVKE